MIIWVPRIPFRNARSPLTTRGRPKARRRSMRSSSGPIMPVLGMMQSLPRSRRPLLARIARHTNARVKRSIPTPWSPRPSAATAEREMIHAEPHVRKGSAHHGAAQDIPAVMAVVEPAGRGDVCCAGQWEERDYKEVDGRRGVLVA
jgi:hypothetical protein